MSWAMFLRPEDDTEWQFQGITEHEEMALEFEEVAEGTGQEVKVFDLDS